MKKKARLKKGIFINIVLFAIGVLFLLIGIMAYFSNFYPYNIYLSKPITLSIAQNIENLYLIEGEISNNRVESVAEDKLEFRCYSGDKSVYGTYSIENIVIDAGKYYKIYEEVVGIGTTKYTNARLYSATVQGEEIQLQYSADGKSFSNKQNELTAIVAGVLMIIIGGVLLFRQLRKRKLENEREQIDREGNKRN